MRLRKQHLPSASEISSVFAPSILAAIFTIFRMASEQKTRLIREDMMKNPHRNLYYYLPIHLHKLTLDPSIFFSPIQTSHLFPPTSSLWVSSSKKRLGFLPDIISNTGFQVILQNYAKSLHVGLSVKRFVLASKHT